MADILSDEEFGYECLALDNMEAGLPRAWKQSHRAAVNRMQASHRALREENERLAIGAGCLETCRGTPTRTFEG